MYDIVKYAELFLKLATIHSKVKDLPNTIQKALSNLGYRKPDISIESAETFSVQGVSGDGRKAWRNKIF